MKDQLIDEITNYILSIKDREIAAPDIKMNLCILMKNYKVDAAETALALRDEEKNKWYLQKFVISKTVKGCTDRTIHYYKTQIENALAEIGKNADEITADDVRLFLAVKERKCGWSKVTCDNALRCLRSFFAYLTLEELIEKDPTRKIDAIKAPKTSKKAFTEIEVEMIRGACQNVKETVIVEILLSTGCRVSELAQIKESDINNDECIIHGKGKKDRTVYFNAKAQVAIMNYLKEKAKSNNPYLFPKVIYGNEIAKTGKLKYLKEIWKHPELFVDGHMDKSSIEQTVRKIGKRSGVSNCHPHRFRRTCATYALRHGMPIEQVSKILGHEQLSTTQIYLDMDEQALKTAHKRYVV